jgi:precorrin-6A/cobalt-precorrin-6A reductase
MTVLLLGGTADAITLAHTLHRRDIKLIYSIAGLVRQPELPCAVISGGFSRYGGLRAYIDSERISMLIDATHPYAAKMSNTAARVGAEAGIPCWRYLRPPWATQEGDNWHEFERWEQLADALFDHEAVFFTVGRLPQTFVDSLYLWSRNNAQRQWVRSAIKPAFDMPPSMSWIEAIGPYELELERELMKKHRIDALVSKNSGGAQTVAKLEIARERKIPVYMLKCPILPPVEREYSDLGECCEQICEHLAGRSSTDGG